jgi:hypothetical protein
VNFLHFFLGVTAVMVIWHFLAGMLPSVQQFVRQG